MHRLARLLSLAAALVAGHPLHAQESLAMLSSFRTPSGNIHCEEWKIDAPRKTELRCDVLTSTVPRRRRPANCELEYGYAFMLSARRAAWLLCAGDTMVDPEHPVLPYGTIWRGTGITCDATARRLRCRNRDGHGFALSRRGQRTF